MLSANGSSVVCSAHAMFDSLAAADKCFAAVAGEY